MSVTFKRIQAGSYEASNGYAIERGEAIDRDGPDGWNVLDTYGENIVWVATLAEAKREIESIAAKATEDDGIRAQAARYARDRRSDGIANHSIRLDIADVVAGRVAIMETYYEVKSEKAARAAKLAALYGKEIEG